MEEIITYKVLQLHDIHSNQLKYFTRHQKTSQVWYQNGEHYEVKDDHFIDEWDDEKKQQVIQSLQQCLLTGGVVIGAYVKNRLIGFANVEGVLFGSKKKYLELSYIHVSNELRGKGIGKRLFNHCCKKAKLLGAKKLYIAAHPSIETQNFYQSVGCTYAEEINPEILAKEPLDIQMEKIL